MGGPVGRIGTRAFNLVPRFFFSRGLAGRTAPQVIRLYLAPWRDPARRKAAVIAPRQLIKATAYLRRVESGLPALASTPALIVWGTADFAFRDRERERFERAFPGHTTIQYPNASHFLQEDAGEEIAEQVTTFLRGLQTP
jgi:haloalkane dehalogenase